jgi:dynein heavy chain
MNIVASFTRLMDTFVANEKSIAYENEPKNEIYMGLLEKWFTYALIWSFGSTVNEEGRKIIDTYVREIESMFPV